MLGMHLAYFFEMLSAFCELKRQGRQTHINLEKLFPDKRDYLGREGRSPDKQAVGNVCVFRGDHGMICISCRNSN